MVHFLSGHPHSPAFFSIPRSLSIFIKDCSSLFIPSNFESLTKTFCLVGSFCIESTPWTFAPLASTNQMSGWQACINRPDLLFIQYSFCFQPGLSSSTYSSVVKHVRTLTTHICVDYLLSALPGWVEPVMDFYEWQQQVIQILSHWILSSSPLIRFLDYIEIIKNKWKILSEYFAKNWVITCPHCDLLHRRNDWKHLNSRRDY